MKILRTALPEVLVLEPRVFADARGLFFELWNKKTQAEIFGFEPNFVQDNRSRSQRGVLRGMHYQIEQPQGKLLTVISGHIFDVAVDMRRSSPNFGKWISVELSGDNHRQIWVPPGFAHGFLVLSDKADVLYKTTDYYAPEHERCLIWNDPTVAIDWPLHGIEPSLSDKDRSGQRLSDVQAFR